MTRLKIARRFARKFVAAPAMLAICMAQPAGAQSTFNSSAATSPASALNNWNSAANWIPNEVPNAVDAAIVVPQGSVAFNLRLQTFAATVNSLTFDNTA